MEGRLGDGVFLALAVVGDVGVLGEAVVFKERVLGSRGNFSTDGLPGTGLLSGAESVNNSDLSEETFRSNSFFSSDWLLTNRVFFTEGLGDSPASFSEEKSNSGVSSDWRLLGVTDFSACAFLRDIVLSSDLLLISLVFFTDPFLDSEPASCSRSCVGKPLQTVVFSLAPFQCKICSLTNDFF